VQLEQWLLQVLLELWLQRGPLEPWLPQGPLEPWLPRGLQEQQGQQLELASRIVIPLKPAPEQSVKAKYFS
jgi:hypothetical protein